MKRIIITSILAIIAILPCSAQWRTGLGAGAALNHYSMDMRYMDDYRIGDRWGASASVMAQYNFADWFGIRGEVNYIQKDYRIYRTGYYKQYDYLTHNKYLQVPLMASMSFGGEALRGFTNLGVYGAYWLQTGRKGTMPDSDLYFDEEGEAYPIETTGFNTLRDQRWDFGLAGGVGIDWLFTDFLGIQAEARLYYGLLNTINPGAISKDYRYNTTLALQATIYYLF